jgi:hypothetical protein
LVAQYYSFCGARSLLLLLCGGGGGGGEGRCFCGVAVVVWRAPTEPH